MAQQSMVELPWVNECIQDSILTPLPTALVDESSSDTSDDDAPSTSSALRRTFGGRLAMPHVTTAYYPSGAVPRCWRVHRTVSTPDPGVLFPSASCVNFRVASGSAYPGEPMRSADWALNLHSFASGAATQTQKSTGEQMESCKAASGQGSHN